MSKKILIVGGTGFIGSNLAIIAIKKGWIVTSISLKKPKKKRLVKKVKYIQCDISNKIKLKKCIKKNQYDYVINCGGHVDHKNKKKVFLSHYIGCKNLTDFFIGDKLLKSFSDLEKIPGLNKLNVNANSYGLLIAGVADRSNTRVPSFSDLS